MSGSLNYRLNLYQHFLLTWVLIFAVNAHACGQNHYLNRRLCGVNNGYDRLTSMDVVDGKLFLAGLVIHDFGLTQGIQNVMTDLNGTTLAKSELVYDTTNFFNGFGRSSVVVGDSVLVAGGIGWPNDTVLPTLTRIGKNGQIYAPDIKSEEGFSYASFAQIVQTEDGGLMMLGSVRTDTGFYEFLLTKTNPDGEIQWNKTFGTEDLDLGVSICKGPDGGYFLGGLSRGVGHKPKLHIFIIWVDSNGKEIWRGDWGGYYDDWLGNMEYKEGVGLLVTGSKSREKHAVAPSEAAYVMMLNEKGVMLWDYYFDKGRDTSGYDGFYQGIFLENGQIMVVGKGELFGLSSLQFCPTTVIFNPHGKLLKKRIYASVVNEKSHAWFEDVQQLSDGRIIAGGVYLLDTTNAQDTGNQDILIVELDENGCEYPGCQPPLGLEKVMEGEGVSAMHVFPNPGNGHFTIQCQDPVRSWSLTGMDGRLLMEGGTEAAAFEINASHLPAGMYIHSVLGQNRQWVKRVVKE